MGRFNRERYLEYDEPEVLCKCGKRAPLITSWRSKNPGRRFVCCLNEEEGCGFWDWYDPKLEQPKYTHYCHLMKDLREEKHGLLSELKFMSRKSKGCNSSYVSSAGEQSSFCSTSTKELKEASNNQGLGCLKLGVLCFIVMVVLFMFI